MYNTQRASFPALLKVAIIDDSPIVVDRIEVLLCDLPDVLVVGFADDFTLAKQLINEQKPEVVILDIRLEKDSPHYNGMHLLACFKSWYPHMVIIMLTNLAMEQYREKCMQLGADYFFDKSNEFDKVVEVIKTLH